MGGKNSRLPNAANGNLLDNSAWLRTVVQHYQKHRHRHHHAHGGVNGFDGFVIEPLMTDCNGVEHFRVSVAFRNGKNKTQQVFWMVKVAQNHEIQAVVPSPTDIVHHELRVYTELLADIGKFLSNKRNQRAKFLLNVPDIVYQDRLQNNGRILRCHLVTEDVTETKRCNPLKMSRIISGLKLGQFKVLLGTLAQFHAVGIAFSLSGSASDSLLESYPFLHSPKNTEEMMKRQVHLTNYLRLLSRYFAENSREIQLFKMLLDQSDQLLKADDNQDLLCDNLAGTCLGAVMSHEVMFQYESNFFDLCGVGGADNIIWNVNNTASDGDEDDDEDVSSTSPICAAVTTCHRVHFGHLLKELAVYFFTLPEPLIRERYVVFLLQSYCHVLTMTLEMLDVNWGKHFADLTFNKMIHIFYRYIPQAVLKAVIAHMELTDPTQLEALLSDKVVPVIDVPKCLTPLKYIPLTQERVEFLLSLMNRVHKPI